MRSPFLTGSRAYGVATEESDWDVVVLTEETDKIAEMLGDLELEVTIVDEGYDPPSLRFTVSGYKINIIPVVDGYDYNAWLYATIMMKSRAPVSDRDSRIEAFQNLVSNYRASQGRVSKDFGSIADWDDIPF
jgi:hypothetical protein